MTWLSFGAGVYCGALIVMAAFVWWPWVKRMENDGEKGGG